MDERLQAAEAALKAGRTAEAIELIIATLRDEPAQPIQVYRALTLQLYNHKRYEEGEFWTAKAVERFPKDFDLRNLHGVMLRRLQRYDEAIVALDGALRLNGKSASALNNKGNVEIDRGNGPGAEAIFVKLARAEPRNAELQRALGRSLAMQAKYDPAAIRLRQALTLKKDYVDAWLDLSGVDSARERHDDALATLDRALAAVPGESRLLEAKVRILRRAGRLRAAAEFIEAVVKDHDEAWAHYQLAAAVSDYDRERANVHYQRAADLEPQNFEYAMALAESFDRSRYGDEGAHIQAGYDVLKKVVDDAPLTATFTKIAQEILVRLGDYEAIDRLGDFETVGRRWADAGKHTALLKHLGRVRSSEDRLELIEQHLRWGRMVEDATKTMPIVKSAGPRASGRIRLGFMSSDLRNHPVTYFAYPLFEHIDRERFEIYCYSFYQGDEADSRQKQLTQIVDVFRWNREISDRDAAQMIADDQIDMLIELGGSTHMNRLGVMAYKPAKLSASWLGYPHSTGLSTVDYLIVDPFLKPPKRELLIEQPLEMPHSWIAMSKQAFPDVHAINPVPPFERAGMVTFGTANNPYKYGPEVLRLWARTVAAVPGSRFLFIRPESGAHTFRENMRAHFAAEGVSGDRVLFNAVRGTHMRHYNDIDITLDTFPQTGGTTTCESLWMGVPTVSLVGEALFERLSYSILNNAGLADLCVETEEAFVDVAMRLAADKARLTDLRVNLRDRLKASPLGQTEQFARDFYEMIAGAVQARLGLKLSA